MSRAFLLLSALLAGSVGGGVACVGFTLVSSSAPAGALVAPTDLLPATGEAAALAREIAALRGELAAATARWTMHPESGEPRRQAVAGDAFAGIERKLDELLLAVAAMPATPVAGVQEVLEAQRQNPMPDLARARALWDSLENDTKAGTSVTRQQWLLLGMADVVRRLGSPMHILVENPRTQSWEYFLDKDTALVVRFVDGLVTSVTQ